MVLTVLIFIITILVASRVYYKKWVHSYWDRKGIYTFEFPKGTHYPLVSGYKILREKGLKYGGLYNYFRPYLLTTDLDFAKSIMIKNFDHFVNRGSYFNEKDDPLSATLENLENENWKKVRSMVTPAFSTGKLKQMFPTLVDHTKSLIAVMNEYADAKKPVHVKEIIECFAMDAIGSSAFGIELDTLHHKNKDFQETIKETTKVDWRRLVAYFVNREILRFLGFRTGRYKVFNYFRDMVKDVGEYRKNNKIYRRDLFQYLSQLENNEQIIEGGEDLRLIKHHRLTLNQITTQCFSFFVGGFETSSTLISFALLEIALNQDIQDRLRKNITENLNEYDGFTYEAVRGMYYLEWVINETLRKHPPAHSTNRCCNKRFQIPNTDIVIDPGVKIVVPIYSIHNDPEYYPEPDKFDPDRFSPENKAQRDQMIFIPFGDGPRNCIGSRLALMEAKIGVASILNNFEISINEKTKQPITYSTNSLLLTVEGGVWLNLKRLVD